MGGAGFFTVVTYRRQPVLCDDVVRVALRRAIEQTRVNWPFRVDAWVLLPDHLHCIWTLPDGDADFSTRWNLIKPGRVRMFSSCVRCMKYETKNK